MIDNCEHLLGEVAEVVDRLVDASSVVAVVTTSQAPLGVRGEHVWVVGPLSGSRGVSGDSVELFEDRARMARADFALTRDNEAAVLEICERLDHIPLAIELAAARVRGMTPADIARRLDQRLRLLATSDRLAPGRHRTLDAAVRWSYELLDEKQRRVFDRLSVFAGPFTIDAAEAIVADERVDDWEILDGILALVDKSLVVADEETADTRYRLLETMRQFGTANLIDAGVHALYRDRCAEYYADYVLSRQAQLHGSGDQAALDDIERELENIRVALRHSADDHASSRYEMLYSTLFTLWIARRGRSSEGAAWAAELRHRPDLDPALRIVALGFAASVSNNCNLALAEDLAHIATDLSASTRAAPALLAMSVMALGALMQGRADDAVAGSDRVIELAADESDLFIRAMVLQQSYAVLAICGAFDRLDDLLRDLTQLTEALDNEYLRAAAANSMAPIIHLTDPDRAGEYLRQGYELNTRIGSLFGAGTTLMFLALHELRSGNSIAAAEWARRSLQLSIDQAPAYISQVTNTAVAIVKRDSPADAAVLLGALRARRERMHQAGSPTEIDSEARYEASLRRRLGDEFAGLHAQGAALDEPAMIELTFTHLDAITATSGSAKGQ